MRTRNSRVRRTCRGQPPASGRRPSSRLPLQAIEASAEALLDWHRRFATCFRRREQRAWSLFYLCGQLANLGRKTIEAMVLHLRGANVNAVRDLQRFMGEGRWDLPGMLEQQQLVIAEWLGEPEGVVIADGSGFPKQGDQSVGVAYQYCGHLGKVANCQQGVFLVYAGSRGHAFLEAQLYLPEVWFTQAYRERWEACRIPEAQPFRTEPQIAVEMIARLRQRAVVPFRWVAADETYGKSPAFLDGIEALGRWYLAEVPVDTRVWLRRPRIEPPGPSLMGPPRTQPRVARSAAAPQTVKQLAAALPKSSWRRKLIKEGSKGPMIAEFAFLRAITIRDGLPGRQVWVIFRRTLGRLAELKVYFSNAPIRCPQTEFIRVSGMRWPVETALEEGKNELGMDHYETRTWPAWHRHMAHTFLAHLFLAGLCRLWKKKPGPDHCPGTPVDCPSHRRSCSAVARRHYHPALSAAPQPRGLSFTS